MAMRAIGRCRRRTAGDGADAEENIVIVRRRTWLYRLAGQMFAQLISFDRPVTVSMARSGIRRQVGEPLEIWGRGHKDPVALSK
jgi:hypothetical protein